MSNRDAPVGRVIASEELGECQRWQMPQVGPQTTGQSGNAGIPMRPQTVEQIEAVQRQAHAEAYQVGYQEGLREGRAAAVEEMQQRVARMDRLLKTLAEPFSDLDRCVEQELVTLATLVARHLVRREIKTDPGQVVATVREAMQALPVAARNVRLHVHPEDAALIRSAMHIGEQDSPWRIEEDPAMARGGCKVLADDSHIDATVETRLSAVVARLLGGVRDDDTAGP